MCPQATLVQKCYNWGGILIFYLNDLLIKELSKISGFKDTFLERVLIEDGGNESSQSNEQEIEISREVIIEYLTKSGYELTQENYDMAEQMLKSKDANKLASTLENAGKIPGQDKYKIVNHLYDLSVDELKSLLSLEILNRLTSIDNNISKVKYTYAVEKIRDVFGGSSNSVGMEETLNRYAKYGYRLVSAFTNELGKNAVSVGNVGINSTVDEVVLIFEKAVVEED